MISIFWYSRLRIEDWGHGAWGMGPRIPVAHRSSSVVSSSALFLHLQSPVPLPRHLSKSWSHRRWEHIEDGHGRWKGSVGFLILILMLISPFPSQKGHVSTVLLRIECRGWLDWITLQFPPNVFRRRWDRHKPLFPVSSFLTVS